MANYTITHSEKAGAFGTGGGWTSFWSYVPDWMTRLGNRFYSFKSGQLWIHNDIDNPLRNNFYGTQYGSSIKTVLNEAMEDDKIFKTIVLESNQKWNAQLFTNLTEGTLDDSEFTTHESRQFTFLRKNEDATQPGGHAKVGIGVITVELSGVITFRKLPELLSIGDRLFQISGGSEIEIGLITDLNRKLNTVTITTEINTPLVGLYCFSKKNTRVEGAEIRGYYLEVILSNDDPTPGTLHAVSTNAVKSFI